MTTGIPHHEPRGFGVHTAPVGLGDDGRDDFTVVCSAVPSAVSAVFTRPRFAGPSVVLSARDAVVPACNANVATGSQGESDAREVRASVATALGVSEAGLLITSTGVIGRRHAGAASRQHPRTGTRSAYSSRVRLTRVPAVPTTWRS